MKITADQLAFMEREIRTIPEFDMQKHYRELKTGDRVKDLKKRFMWDCFWAAGLSYYATDVLHKLGINDDYINTALNKIFKKLNLGE